MMGSSWGLACSEIDESLILGNSVLVDALVVETAHGWFDIVSLSHFEVLSEILVSAPPIEMDHANSLVSSHLMEVRISHVVLLTISGQTSVSVRVIIMPIVFSNMPSPL